MLLETGRLEEAAEQLTMLAANDFVDIPRDGDWMTTVTLLSEVSAGLGDAPSAARLYELLTPFAQLNVVIGVGALCLGSAARFLGKLAVALGDQQAAAEHFEQALEANSRLKAPLWLAHTRLDYGQALGRGVRAQRMIDEARETAELLGLPALRRRVERVWPLALPSPDSCRRHS